MLIAITADGKDLSGAVSEQFETCLYLLLVETESGTVEAVASDGADRLADIMIERDCEAVITGSFTPEIFNVIADACITRYCGGGLTAGEALARMEDDALEYIRYADGDDSCHGDHGGGECRCGEDD
jgi:predicted Fe-Mo cluster-binding NifX family protein